MPPASDTESTLKRTLLLLALIVLGLALYVVMVEAVGAVTVHDWQPAFTTRAHFLWLNVWLPWCLIGPALVWFIRSYPITPTIWRRRLLLHLAVFMLAVFVHHLVVAYRYHYAVAPQSPTMASYAGWQHMGHFLIGDNLFLFDSILYIVFVASFNLADFFWALQQQTLRNARLQSSLQRAQLQMLQMQVQPHFLFNILNAISVLVRKRDDGQALDMLQGLARFFRGSLAATDQACVPLANEFSVMADYLALERLRFGERLQVRQDIAADTLQQPVPPFLLQPLIENAIRHGFADKEDVGVLQLRAFRQSRQLVVQILDNGNGCDFSAPGFREGVGLQNVRERLRLHYGDRATMLLQGAPGQGVNITLQLPLDDDAGGVRT